MYLGWVFLDSYASYSSGEVQPYFYSNYSSIKLYPDCFYIGVL